MVVEGDDTLGRPSQIGHDEADVRDAGASGEHPAAGGRAQLGSAVRWCPSPTWSYGHGEARECSSHGGCAPHGGRAHDDGTLAVPLRSTRPLVRRPSMGSDPAHQDWDPASPSRFPRWIGWLRPDWRGERKRGSLESTGTTLDGTPITLRPIRPEDEPVLQDLFAHMSREDVRLRFFAPMHELSHAPTSRPPLPLRQLRSIEGEIPSSLAIWINGRPLLANRPTASRLNSSVN